MKGYTITQMIHQHHQKRLRRHIFSTSLTVYRSTAAHADVDKFSVGQNALEEKLPVAREEVQECSEVVRKASNERTEAWAQWKAAHDESASCRLLQQHLRAEQQLQRAVASSTSHMQVYGPILQNPCCSPRVVFQRKCRCY